MAQSPGGPYGTALAKTSPLTNAWFRVAALAEALSGQQTLGRSPVPDHFTR